MCIGAMEEGRRDVRWGYANVWLQLVEMVGPGSIVRVMSDRRTV